MGLFILCPRSSNQTSEMPSTNGCRPAGLSFVEILVATLLITAFAIPVIVLSQRGLVEAGDTQEAIIVRQVSINLSERFRRSRPDELRRVAAQPQLLDSDGLLMPLDQARGLGGRGMQIQRWVGLVEDLDGQRGLHRVDYIVSWSSPSHRLQTLSLSRLIHWH